MMMIMDGDAGTESQRQDEHVNDEELTYEERVVDVIADWVVEQVL
jgi:hypothetical protein